MCIAIESLLRVNRSEVFGGDFFDTIGQKQTSSMLVTAPSGRFVGKALRRNYEPIINQVRKAIFAGRKIRSIPIKQEGRNRLDGLAYVYDKQKIKLGQYRRLAQHVGCCKLCA